MVSPAYFDLEGFTPRWLSKAPKYGYVISYGTVVGQGHAKVGIPCQDHAEVWKDRDFVVGVVADGCTSSKNSHIGAQRISKWVIAGLCNQRPWFFQNFNDLMKNQPLRSHENPEWDAEIHTLAEHLARKVAGYVVRRIKQDAQQLSDIASQVEYVKQTYLATANVIVLIHGVAIYFGWGDGVYWFGRKNSKIEVIDENNNPHYLAYQAMIELDSRLENTISSFIPTSFRSDIISLSSLERCVIASDGAEPFVTQVANFYLTVPDSEGLTDKVGDFNQFYDQVCFIQDPQAVQKRLEHLVVTNRFLREGDPKTGNLARPFNDDVGVLFIRLVAKE